eukprot:TRINITY_DN2619_c0_g1_i1.p1 TRINITY_DN2619_c0_g1~~TRINITY_DN2619_c0_g1_i1.p1  ORF type:complete len:674 (+),score=188.14 TRINITY_DN2619_c0_g1_i1:878-2899(+)
MTNSKKRILEQYESIKKELNVKKERIKVLKKQNEMLENEYKIVSSELTQLKERLILPRPSESFLYRSKKIIEEQNTLLSFENQNSYDFEQFLDVNQLENRLYAIQEKHLPKFGQTSLIIGKDIEYIDLRKNLKPVIHRNVINNENKPINKGLNHFKTDSKLRDSILKMSSMEFDDLEMPDMKEPVFSFDSSAPVHYREYMFKECQQLTFTNLIEFPSSDVLTSNDHYFRIGEINSPFIYMSPLKLFEVITGANAPLDILEMVLKLRFLLFSVPDLLHILHIRLRINIPLNCIDAYSYDKEVIKPIQKAVVTFLSKWIVMAPKDFLEPEAEPYIYDLIKDFEEINFDGMATLLRQVAHLDDNNNSTSATNMGIFGNPVVLSTKSKVNGVSLFNFEEEEINEQQNENSRINESNSTVTFDDSQVLAMDFSTSKLVVDEINEHILSEHLCMIDQKKWSDIPLREIVAYVVHSNHMERLSPGLIEFLERSNLVTNWVVTNVLTEFQFKRRKAIVSHFLKVATLLASYYNFYGAMAVYGGLSGYAVSKFKDVFNSLSTNKKNMEQKLKELCSFKENSKFYRNLVSQVATSKQTFIPHIGLVLQDLTFLHDGNPTMKNGCLNIFKLLKMTEILEGVIASKRQLNYNFRLNNSLVNALTEDILSFDEKVLKHLSLKIGEA